MLKPSTNIRAKTLKKNGVIYIRLPPDHVKYYNLTGEEDEEIDIVIHRKIYIKENEKKVKNICGLWVFE